jgi:BolA-like protein 3
MLSVCRVRFNQYISQIEGLLKQKLSASEVSVVDTSGGCGQSYHIKVTSPEFLNKPLIAQHKLVKNVLREEISKWHAVRIETKSADSSSD